MNDLGTLGGAEAYATGLNDLGQISGSSGTKSGGSHAFRWSKATGMVDLGALSGGDSSGAAINSAGLVVGNSGPALSPVHAFRSNAAGAMEDLGTIATGTSAAVAINAAGLIAGFSDSAAGDAHAFAWTGATGMVDIGTLGGVASYAAAVGAAGEVAGYSMVPGADFFNHAFLWTRGGGMRDLGTAGGTESFVLAMTPQTDLAGVINTPGGDQHAMAWTPARGMVDLGTFGGVNSRALALNTKGQVVGGAMMPDGDWRAFVWTAGRGKVDLNSRLRHPPAGLRMDIALAISDKGVIVATSNAGLVMLTPVGLAHMRAPAVGPIAAPAVGRAGTPVAVSATFADEDPAAAHTVKWSWGDGSAAETGVVTESKGAGSASAAHSYRAAGVYTVVAKVADAQGNSASVSRTVVVNDSAPGAVGGNGTLLSPRGADKRSPSQAGKASFSFVAPAAGMRGGTGQLKFNAANLIFRSTSLNPAAQASSGQYAGSGTINGRGDYTFTLAVNGEDAGSGRFGIRIWHVNPKSGATVVDYDNRNAGGSPLAEGAIAFQP